MIRRIIQIPDPRLLEPSVLVDPRAAEIKTIIADLVDTRIAHKALGLSAVQIGKHARVVAVSPKEFYGFSVLVNPEISDRGQQLTNEPEGCMSISGGVTRFLVRRHEIVTVRFLGRDSVERVVVAKRLAARLVQHEIDHLDGITIHQRLALLAQRNTT